MPLWIDYRDELRRLIDGDQRTIAQSFWIVVRIMRLGQYSQYWDSQRSEAIGGPKWLYDDHIVRAIKYPGGNLGRRPKIDEGGGVIVETGRDDVNTSIFAIEWNPAFARLPAAGEDLLYEIAEFEGLEQPQPPLHVTGRYRIMLPLLNHGDLGRVEGIYLLAERLHGES